MPSRYGLPRTVFLLLLATGLGHLAAVPLAASETGEEPPISEPVPVTDAETLWRWIGIKDSALTDCPTPPLDSPWTTRPLFAEPDPLYTLDDFCLYESTNLGPATHVSDLLALQNDGWLTSLQADRMVVFGLATTLRTDLMPQLQAQFDLHVGEVDLPIHPQAPLVRLSLLDTSPTSGMNLGGLPENSPHGQTLKDFSQHLLCDDVTHQCVAQVTTGLALGYNDFNHEVLIHRDEVQGGHLGTISDLAEAIWLEVRRAKATSQRQVINLSVAWDGLFGGSETNVSAMPSDVQAVYRAIQGAACGGAAVIAAAGNLSDEWGPTQGPLYPAAWTTRRDASGTFCLGVGPWSPRLLYAVGGVQANGNPLVNARPASATEWAAYGDHASIIDPQTGDVTEILTGSSVSSLVASATAAALMYYRPSLSVFQVMQEIYTSGTLLTRTAEICPWGTPCPQVSYLSLCQAVAQVCPNNTQGYCPATPPSCTPRPFTAPSYSVNDFAEFYDLNTPGLMMLDGAQVSQPYPPTSVCGQHTPLYQAPFLPSDPCPHRQYLGLSRNPWSLPQPGAQPCPGCVLFPNDGELFVEVDSGFTGTLSNPTLIACPGGNATALSLSPPSPLAPGSSLTVLGLPQSIAGCTTAQLSFTVNFNGTVYSTTSPLLVAQH